MQGSIIAEELDLDCAPCGQAPQVLCFLSNSFWNSTGGYLTADVNVGNVDRSGINTDQILGSIHGFDIEAPCDAKSEWSGIINYTSRQTHVLCRLSALQ